MEKFKKILYIIFFPPFILTIILFIISMLLLLYSITNFDSNSIYCIFSYVLAFYSLLILSFRIPYIIKLINKLKNENKYVLKLRNDTNLRVNIILTFSLIWNILYALFQVYLAIYNNNNMLWFFTMAFYYSIIAIMKFSLIKYTINNPPSSNLELEIKKYRLCGYLLLILNIAVSVMIFFFLYLNKELKKNQIVTIALATYTFTAFIVALIGYFKYKKYNSFVYMALKTITLICASVSMMTLTVTMLSTFGIDDNSNTDNIIKTIVGITLSLFILTMSIFMIYKSYTQKNIKHRES